MARDLLCQKCAPLAIERRSKIRFPLEMRLSYSAIRRHSGFGKTVDVSSAGMLLELDGFVPAGTKLHLLLEWPCLLDWSVPMSMTVETRVVRCIGNRAAVRLLSYEFKTRRGPLLARERAIAS